MDTLKLLVARVARAFYETKHIVALDMLCRHPVVKDDDLAAYLRLTTREIHKICGKLREDKLIKLETKNEAKNKEQRPIPKTYYYIDFKQFVDALKWKLYKLSKSYEEKMKNEIENKGYVCPCCDRTFTALEVQSLIDMSTFLFMCDVCHTELAENNNSQNVKGAQEMHSKLMEQAKPLLQLLRQTDNIIIPAAQPLSVLIANSVGANNTLLTSEKELNIAGSKGDQGQSGDIVVVFEDDRSKDTMKAEKDAEAQKKREQNALPIWHQQSTVSAFSSLLLDNTKKEMSNVVSDGQGASHSTFGDQLSEDDHKEQQERHKFYEDYYARLRGIPETQEDKEDDWEDSDINDEEFMDVNPSTSKKRSLDDGERDSGTEKKQKPDPTTCFEEEFSEDEDEDPVVMVQGEPVLMSLINDDHISKMSKEEYLKYYELHKQHAA